MIIGRKHYRMRHFLGEQMLTESWAVEDDEPSMAWMAYFREAEQEKEHPEVRLEITYFTEGATEVIRPRNPTDLDEYVGPQ